MDATTKAEIDRRLQDAGLKLREHQVEGIDFLLKTFSANHGAILADEMGLGKTCQSVVTLLVQQLQHGLNGPHLVICPLSVFETWQNEIKRFGGGLTCVSYRGTKEERTKQRAQWLRPDKDWHIFLSTYELVVKDAEFLLPVTWQSIVIDEAHRVKNSESILHGQLRQMQFRWLLLLTGTPVQNNLAELHSLLQLVAPDKYTSDNKAEFVTKYATYKDKQAMQELRNILAVYMLRRTKDTIALDIPLKSEVVLYHSITQLQKKLYKAILVKNHEAFESASKNQQQSLMNVLMQLRKCVAHPYLFDGVEPEPFAEGEHLVEACDKLAVLDRLLAHCRARQHRVLLFSQMTRVLDILQDYLTFRGHSYERLDGSVRSDERFAAVRNFNAAQSSTFVFLLSTRAGGLGLTLTAADTVIFYDSDFNPQNDLQAAARAHRIGQTKPVKIIRLLGRNTVEEIIQSRAADKLKLTHAVIGSENEDPEQSRLTAAELSEMLTHGLRDIAKADEASKAQPAKTKEQMRADMEKHLTAVLGDTDAAGHWLPVGASAASSNSAETLPADASSSQPAPDMYVYEGTDYKKIRQEVEKESESGKALADRLALQLLLDEGKQTYGQLAKRPKGARKTSTDTPTVPLEQLGLSAAALEERRQKLAEAAERRRQMLADRQKQLAEQRMQRVKDKWQKNNYTSRSLAIPDAGDAASTPATAIDIATDADDDQDEEERARVHFVRGSVASPQGQGRDADTHRLILHAVDNSGRWGRGGVFAALEAVYSDVAEQYEAAFQMSDLKLGDAHLMQVGDKTSVALLVAQSKAQRDTLNMTHLEAALVKLSAHIRQQQQQQPATGYSAHVARIGYGMPLVRWYTVERMLNRYLCRLAHINTYVYYYKKNAQPGAAAKRQALVATPVLQSPAAQDATVGHSQNGDNNKRARLDEGTGDRESASVRHSPSPLGQPQQQLFAGVRLHWDEASTQPADRHKLARLVLAFGGDTLDVNAHNCTHAVFGDEAAKDAHASEFSEYQKLLTTDQLRDAIRNRSAL